MHEGPRRSGGGAVWLVALWVVGACGIGAAAARADDARYIRIATFNIANFGAGDETLRSLAGLANILTAVDGDLVLIQEVAPGQRGAEAAGRLVELLNRAAAYYQRPPYQVALGDALSGDEAYAFLWRSPVELLASPAPMPHAVDPDGDGLRTFQRVPSAALFRAGELDFWAVTCHLYTQVAGRSSEGRGAELAAIATWLAALTNQGERDAVVAGDFNRLLNGGGPWRTFLREGSPRVFRAPLLEAIAAAHPGFNPLSDDAPEDRFSTTTGPKGSIYDQVLVSAGLYRECAVSPEFGVDVGIVAFDNDPHYAWVAEDWKLVTAVLSDHRPVWLRLRIDLPDDDEAGNRDVRGVVP